MAENDPDDLSGLPPKPTPEQLPEAYRLCRKKLARANWSRSALKGHDDYRCSLISELRADLEQLEVGFHKEASERAAVHALNERVLEIVQSLADTKKTGSEKREAAVKKLTTEARKQGISASESLVRFTIESAVQRYKLSL